MPGTKPNILDVSVVAVPVTPLSRVVNPRAIFEDEAFQDHLSPPVNYSQGLMVDTVGNNFPTYHIESMRSQKTITISGPRIEIHDRSGRLDFAQTDIAPLAEKVIASLDLGELRAMGANLEMSYKLSEEQGTAVQAIGKRIVLEGLSLPKDIHQSGASARLHLTGDDETKYILFVEPRFGDTTTQEIFLASNVEQATSASLSVDQIMRLLQSGFTVLRASAVQLFPELDKALPSVRGR